MAQAGTAAVSRSTQVENATQLRLAKLTALRARQGNVVTQNPAANGAGMDPQAELAYSRSADKLANGIGFAPLAADYGADENLAQELGDEENEDAYEQEMLALQQQAQAQDRMEDTPRTRSRMRGMKENHEEEQRKKMMKEFEKWLKKRQFDLTSKGSSVVDQVEFLEVMDALGVSASTIQLIVTVFKDSIPEEIQDKIPIKPLEPGKSMADVAVLASYAPQVLWMSIKIIIILMIPFIVPAILAGACHASTLCRATYWAYAEFMFNLIF